MGFWHPGPIYAVHPYVSFLTTVYSIFEIFFNFRQFGILIKDRRRVLHLHECQHKNPGPASRLIAQWQMARLHLPHLQFQIRHFSLY